MREKGFNKSKQLIFSNFSRIPNNLYNINNTFVSLNHTYFLVGNTIAYTTIQDTNREKYFIYISSKEKMPTLAENKHLSVKLFFHRPRLYPLSTEECTGLIRQKWTSKWLFLRRQIK